MDSDLAWEQWGRTDPYFGVLTDDQYRNRNLTDDAKAAFFATGAEHVRHVLEVCHRHFDAGFTPQRVLDFGCGTGRLVVPFAGVAAEVVGVDVSESMLAEARRNCEARGLDNVRFVKSTDDLGALSGDFDLIHSFIVFQHIPIGRGMAILRGILERLRPGGLAAVHLTYSNEAFRRFDGVSPALASPVSARIKAWGRQVERTLRRAARGARAADPEMQMNPYNATAILFRIQELGVREVFVEFTNHGGALGTMLYFQRPAKG